MKTPDRDTPTYRVDLLDFGRMPRCPMSGVIQHAPADQFQPWAYTGLLLRGGGRTILVNTGFPDDMAAVQAAFHAWHSAADLVREPHQTLAGQLDRLGVALGDVDHLLLSCLGPYSTGQVDEVKRCPISVGRAEWTDLLAPPVNFPPPGRDIILPPDTLRRLVTDDWPRVRLLEDEDHLSARERPGAGITTFRTGGHHHGSLAVSIPTAAGRVVYADTVFTYRNLDENLPIGFYRNQDEVHAAYARIRREADVVLPFFDPVAFDRYPGGVVAE